MGQEPEIDLENKDQEALLLQYNGDYIAAFEVMRAQTKVLRARVRELEEHCDVMEDSRDNYDLQAQRHKRERDEILKALVQLMLTGKQGTPREEVRSAYNEAKAVIRRFVHEEFDERTADQITMGELVAEISEQGLGLVSVTGHKGETSAECDWYVVATVGTTSDALRRWVEMDFTQDDLTSQLAANAYLAYGNFTGNKNFRGEPMPLWEDLPEAIQGAWMAAAKEIAVLVFSEDYGQTPEGSEVNGT